MRWHEFVFSNEPRYRNRRHLACCILWWLYIVFAFFINREILAIKSTQGLYHHQPGLNELGYLNYSVLVLIKSFLLLLTHLFFCYAIIYILLPKYLSNKKFWLLITTVLVFCFLMVPVVYFLYSVVYPLVDGLFSLPAAKQNKMLLYASIDAGLINAIKLTLVAAAIQILKQWWLKQKEKEQLEKEKINAELQLLKAQVHPAFLFSTLNNIIEHAQAASPKAPEMLIKLSDLLSYMLYECDEPKVKLEKEIGIIKEYIALEKIRQGDRLEMTFQINGDINGQMITPLLLLPFIDHSFSYSNNELVEQAWVNLDITIQDSSMFLKLINGMPTGTTGEPKNDEAFLGNVKKRLELLYPGRHELRINIQQELLMVYLNLNLEEIAGEQPTVVEITKPVLSHA